mmetsp:Transcript_34482/g.75408  ORF Transcript_34482/g.75408 Transcript_34482/m.75408 type:complete len:351 (+) Transcript_34482:863-1915(+)
MHKDVARRVPSQEVMDEPDGNDGTGGWGGERMPCEALDKGGGDVGGKERGSQEDVHEVEEALAESRAERVWLQQGVQPVVELWVLQAMLLYQNENAVERKHADEASPVDGVGEEVAEQHRGDHVRHDRDVQLAEHLLVDVLREGELEERQPRLGEVGFLVLLLGPPRPGARPAPPERLPLPLALVFVGRSLARLLRDWHAPCALPRTLRRVYALVHLDVGELERRVCHDVVQVSDDVLGGRLHRGVLHRGLGGFGGGWLLYELLRDARHGAPRVISNVGERQVSPDQHAHKFGAKFVPRYSNPKHLPVELVAEGTRLFGSCTLHESVQSRTLHRGADIPLPEKSLECNFE